MSLTTINGFHLYHLHDSMERINLSIFFALDVFNHKMELANNWHPTGFPRIQSGWIKNILQHVVIHYKDEFPF